MTRGHGSVAALPDEPGVYFFIGTNREVLYVGKATSLRDRVRSYFSTDLAQTRGAHMMQMVEEARRIDFRTTDSVLEALILEARLIKELKPRYNTRDKDDKSFNYLIITTNEQYPRLLTVRGKDLANKLVELVGPCTLHPTTYPLPVYGPFVHAGQFKEALKLIRKIFPFYDTARPVEELRAAHDRKLRFNESIGVFPSGETTPAEYRRTVRHIRAFFDGRKQQLLRSLEREMYAHARAQAFEAAARAKRQMFALQHLNDISLIRRNNDEHGDRRVAAIRIEGYDVAHLGGKNMVGVMTVVVGGEPEKAEYRTFNVRSVDRSNDTAALREVLSRRLEHAEWAYPRLIVVDGGTAQMRVAERLLADAGIEIPVVAVTKDERHRPKVIRGPAALRRAYATEILLANAEAHRFSLARHQRARSRSAFKDQGAT